MSTLESAVLATARSVRKSGSPELVGKVYGCPLMGHPPEQPTPRALLAFPTYGPVSAAAYQAARDAGPVSCSHWGMHA